jgi:hypothetical protein
VLIMVASSAPRMLSRFRAPDAFKSAAAQTRKRSRIAQKS